MVLEAEEGDPPGWDEAANRLENFSDGRDLQAALEAAGVTLDQGAEANTTGPASLMLTDPDGNPILIDQHR